MLGSAGYFLQGAAAGVGGGTRLVPAGASSVGDHGARRARESTRYDVVIARTVSVRICRPHVAVGGTA